MSPAPHNAGSDWLVYEQKNILVLVKFIHAPVCSKWQTIMHFLIAGSKDASFFNNNGGCVCVGRAECNRYYHLWAGPAPTDPAVEDEEGGGGELEEEEEMESVRVSETDFNFLDYIKRFVLTRTLFL